MIFEFPPGADYQLRSLEKVVSGLYPKHKLECIHGFSKSYTPGGFHLHRLLNLAWLYCLVPLKLIFRRPSWLLVRSAPPGIQVWVGLWAGLLGIPSIAWLMDYHPEIEARILDRKVFLRPLAWFLRIVDRFSLQFHRAAVVLDESMAAQLRSACKELPIIVHPTWDSYRNGEERSVGERSDKPLKLAYGGNLGLRHSASSLGELIARVVDRSAHPFVELHVIGSSSNGIRKFEGLASQYPLHLHCYPRMGFEDLLSTLRKIDADYGVVLMNDLDQGLYSPSKYAGYLAAGIPVLYMGPEQTNAYKICQDFGAGIHLSMYAGKARIEDVAGSLCDLQNRREHRFAVASAKEHFAAYNAETFFAAISTFLPSEWGDSSF